MRNGCAGEWLVTNPDNRWLLAIDTSTEQAGLAVTNGEQTAELSWRAGRDQTVSVLEQIDRLLKLAGIAMNDLAAVAIATGPGMFNGLRVGMSLAKGLHLGSGLSLLGVSTLDMTAYPFLALSSNVVATVAAGRGRIVWQRYPGEARPVNGTVEEWTGEIGESALVAGDLSEEQAAMLAAIPGVIVPVPSVRRRRPSALAEIGWSRFANGEQDDPTLLAPVYVHGAPAPVRGG
jgi:tRNA threonylcarbamoyladenosine biosynthesis protein TsaB